MIAERLRDHDRDHGAAVAHAERAGGLHLSLRHRLDARADGLGEIGAGDDRQREAAGAIGAGHPHVQRDRQHEADEHDGDERGQASEHLDVEAGRPAVRPHRRQPHQREHQADGEPAGEAEEREDQGVARRAREDVGEQAAEDFPVEKALLQLGPIGCHQHPGEQRKRCRVDRVADQIGPLASGQCHWRFRLAQTRAPACCQRPLLAEPHLVDRRRSRRTGARSRARRRAPRPASDCPSPRRSRTARRS